MQMTREPFGKRQMIIERCELAALLICSLPIPVTRTQTMSAGCTNLESAIRIALPPFIPIASANSYTFQWYLSPFTGGCLSCKY